MAGFFRRLQRFLDLAGSARPPAVPAEAAWGGGGAVALHTETAAPAGTWGAVQESAGSPFAHRVTWVSFSSPLPASGLRGAGGALGLPPRRPRRVKRGPEALGAEGENSLGSCFKHLLFTSPPSKTKQKKTKKTPTWKCNLTVLPISVACLRQNTLPPKCRAGACVRTWGGAAGLVHLNKHPTASQVNQNDTSLEGWWGEGLWPPALWREKTFNSPCKLQ